MAKKAKRKLAPRKTPRQTRSRLLVDAILEAAIRVLERDGAKAFTTIRVAERAGVSVGSLYQYFPNKQAILMRLQEDEWERTGSMLESVLLDRRLPPEVRVRRTLRAFFRSELEEAPLRRALADATAVYAESERGRERKTRTHPAVVALIGELEPRLGRKPVARAAAMFVATMGALGEHVSETESSVRAVDAWARSVADMFLAYVRSVAREHRLP